MSFSEHCKKPLKADNDIEVYKVVNSIIENGVWFFRTPIMDNYVNFGSRVEATIEPFRQYYVTEENGTKKGLRIEKGIHCFSPEAMVHDNSYSIKMRCGSFPFHQLELFFASQIFEINESRSNILCLTKCVIPKGTVYYKDEYGAIVTECMVYGENIIPITYTAIPLENLTGDRMRVDEFYNKFYMALEKSNYVNV